MANLLVISADVPRIPFDQQRRSEEADETPRATYFDEVVTEGGDVLDGAYLRSVRGWRAALYRRLPAPVAAALEAYRIRRRYNAVICWDDRVAMIYGALLTLTRSQSPHVAMLNWMMPPAKRMMLRFAQRGMGRIIVWNELHRQLLVAFGHINPSKIVHIPYQVDQQFWRPFDGDTDSICAVGNSMRDYGTLVRAMRDLPMTCRIATTVLTQPTRTPDFDMTRQSLEQVEIGPNVVVGSATKAETRSMYARSRFVVLPLPTTFRDSGITAAGEAMAMGKAVICTYTYGMVDTIEHGVNGLFVPPGDPAALRDAIVYLWDHPDVAERMGAEGRRRAESIYALERFTASVHQVTQNVIAKATRGVEAAPIEPNRPPLLRLPLSVKR